MAIEKYQQSNFIAQPTSARIVKFVEVQSLDYWTPALRTDDGFLISLNSLVGHRFDKDGNLVGAMGKVAEALRKCETVKDAINILIGREIMLTPIRFQAYDRKRNCIYTATTFKIDWVE